jgi:hypothetical protein
MDFTMKQTSTKHTNKNTIRSGKTINSGNLDIDHYLDDLNEPDEPVSKTSSSKHDGTITPKSIKVIAPTSNPSHMNKQDARLMKKTFEELLGLNAKAIASAMLFHRIDICADFEKLIDDLIIDLDGVKVGTRFGLTTANGGTIKSIYMGGVESEHHGVAYDQVASDNYKASVGEVTSRRRSLREDAEIAFDATKQGLRIESRRLLKQPVGLAELRKQTDIFGGYKVWEVKPRPGIRMSTELVHYIDCVRLRGFNGARSWSLANAADKQATTAMIAGHEKALRRMVADWWRPDDFNGSLLDVLRQSPAWLFLSVLDKH